MCELCGRYVLTPRETKLARAATLGKKQKPETCSHGTDRKLACGKNRPREKKTAHGMETCDVMEENRHGKNRPRVNQQKSLPASRGCARIWESQGVCIYIYTYIYIHIHIYIHTYIYIYIYIRGAEPSLTYGRPQQNEHLLHIHSHACTSLVVNTQHSVVRNTKNITPHWT